MASQNVSTSATAAVPFIYRFLLTTLEPFFAVNGSFLAYTKLDTYVHMVTRGAIQLPANSIFLGTQLVAAWLYFAFVEAVVLRVVDDLRIWRWLIYGMLISDACYCHSLAQALGGWSEWIKIWEWTGEDWSVTIGTLPFVLVRVLIVLGVGIKKGAVKRE